ncbi:rRNA adenine N-6-methyltransferase family protein, partial [Candidatus Omnitrophota bacterium]
MQKKTFPKKHLGQNFLINQGVLKHIVKTADLIADETVLEIGPGKGALTHLMHEHVGHVIAIEKDSSLVTLLENNLPAENITLINDDFLTFNFEPLS